MGTVPLRDVFWLITLALIWGSSFAAIKVAVVTMPPMTLVAVRTVIAVMVLFPIMIIQRARLPRDVESWKLGFVLGVFGLALPFFLIGWGEEGVESGQAAILMAVMPLATMTLAHFFTKGDPFHWRKLIGIVMGFGGIVILVGPEALKGLGGQLGYQLAIAGGAVCYAVNAVVTRNLPPDSSLIGRAVMVMLCGVAISVPLAVIMDGPTAALGADSAGWWMALYIGILPTGLAMLIYFHIVEARGASFFSYVNYLNPVFGVMWGALLLSEIVQLEAVLALGAILGGIAVSSRPPRPSA